MRIVNVRRNALRVALALVAIFGSANVLAAEGSGTASAEVLKPIAIAEKAQLMFGAFTTDGTASSVTIDASTGNRTAGTGIALFTVNTVQRGQFTITGTAGKTYSVTSASQAILYLNGDTNATAKMTYDPATHSTTSHTLDASTGEDILYTGGVLNVGTSQPQGAYSGSYTVAVEYN